MVARVAIALLLTACTDQASGTPVQGSPLDVATPPGDYVGYRVVTGCATTSIGVTGTGSIALTTLPEISAAGDELHARVARFPSIWGWGGYGLVCEPGIGTQVSLDDWRDVDALILEIGGWLHERDLSLQVGISVGSIPVPQTGS